MSPASQKLSWHLAPTREAYKPVIPTYSNSVSHPQTLSFSHSISAEIPLHWTFTNTKQAKPKNIKKIMFFTVAKIYKKHFFTSVGHKSQVARSTWGTAYQVCHTLCNQTQHQWRDNLKIHIKDMKHQAPISLETNCNHSLVSFLSMNWLYCNSVVVHLLLARTGIHTRTRRTKPGAYTRTQIP